MKKSKTVAYFFKLRSKKTIRIFTNNESWNFQKKKKNRAISIFLFIENEQEIWKIL